MAGKIRHLLLRDGRHYARRIVPHELREFIQKNELRIPLGSDRRAAIEQLPFALVKINSLIDHARDALQARDANAAAGVRALSEPMRETGLAPAGVAPNHGWRHRFKTQSIDLDFNPRVVDAIQGHTGRTASDMTAMEK